MVIKNSKYNNLVFLCGARDFHAMDWYRRSLDELTNINIYILTDLIEGEKFKKLITSKDKVFKLIILDNFLFRDQSLIAHLWRRIIKIIVFPLQVLLIKRFSKKFPNTIFYSHGMYYIWLSKFSGVDFVGRPQGNDILTNPFKSKLYKFLSIKSMQSAKSIILDSFLMSKIIKKITNKKINVSVVPNGIDLNTIKKLNNKTFKNYRKNIVSIRGFAENYRIENILLSRAYSKKTAATPIQFIYPFYDLNYKNHLKNLFIKEDKDISRLNKNELYETLFNTKLVISIPYKDSFPRSVFESIFCGCIVAISYNPYYEYLPLSIKSRIIILDINQKDWFFHAINKADYLIKKPFKPCNQALKNFDQNLTFKKMAKIILR
tara:strand:- start:7576 stop:8703 length:1128 start_codon:yes stop_codon:yes gene_type:complete